MKNTPQLSMSIATMEGKIVDVNAGLNQVVKTAISRYNFHWVIISRLDYRLLAWRGWWLVTVKILFPAKV